MAQLLLLRHGKSAWPVGVADLDRPLAPRGERDARAVGAFLAARRLRPDLVACSPAQRTQATAALVLAAAGGAEQAQIPLHVEEELYDGDVFAVLRRVPAEVGRVLVVGHEPGLLEVLGRLCGAAVRLPTAALALIELNAPWAEQPAGLGVLQLLLTPKLLAGAKWTTV